MNRILFSLIMLCALVSANAEMPDSIALQTLNLSGVVYNQVDDNGNKHGLWIEYAPGDETILDVTCYKNGVEDGPFRQYRSTKDTPRKYSLSYMGFTKMGKPTRDFFNFYEESGNLRYSFSQISPLKDFESRFQNWTDDLYQFYSRYYRENGVIESEGWYASTIDIEIDVERVGEWKFYDEEGNLVKVEDYGKYRK